MESDRLRSLIWGSMLMTIGILAGTTGLAEYTAFLNGFRGVPIGVQVIRFSFFLLAGVLLVMLGWMVGMDQSAS